LCYKNNTKEKNKWLQRVDPLKQKSGYQLEVQSKSKRREATDLLLCLWGGGSGTIRQSGEFSQTRCLQIIFGKGKEEERERKLFLSPNKVGTGFTTLG